MKLQVPWIVLRPAIRNEGVLPSEVHIVAGYERFYGDISVGSSLLVEQGTDSFGVYIIGSVPGRLIFKGMATNTLLKRILEAPLGGTFTYNRSTYRRFDDEELESYNSREFEVV